MNTDALIAELQHNYYLVREVISKMHFDTPADYDAFLAAGFRSAWASSWQRAGRAAPGASGLPSTSSSTGSNGTCTATVSIETAPTTQANLVKVPVSSSEETGGAAARFLLKMLQTRALTDSQYKALCKVLAIQYPARPTEHDVMLLDHDQVVQVLCGGR